MWYVLLKTKHPPHIKYIYLGLFQKKNREGGVSQNGTLLPPLPNWNRSCSSHPKFRNVRTPPQIQSPFSLTENIPESQKNYLCWQPLPIKLNRLPVCDTLNFFLEQPYAMCTFHVFLLYKVRISNTILFTIGIILKTCYYVDCNQCLDSS